MALAEKSTKEIGKQPPRKETSKASFWTPGRVVITVIGAGLIIWYGTSFLGPKEVVNNNPPVNRVAAAPAPKPATNPPVAVPVSLPAGVRDTAVKTIQGESIKLLNFDGKVVVLNIWATWCGPCRQEMPELVKISKEYKDRGVVVLGIATTYNERQRGLEGVKEFITAQKIPYKIIWDDGTLSGPLVDAVQARSVIPQSFVISRDGRIFKHFQGFSLQSTPQRMRDAIEEALNDKGKQKA